MYSRRLVQTVLAIPLFLAIPAFSPAANTPTNTPTLTFTRTPSNTPTVTFTRTPTGTPTDTLTPNPTLTPPCGGAASIFGVTTGSSNSGATNTMRASMFSLNVPATIYSVWLRSSNAGYQAMVGIYSGPVSTIGSLVVSASPQTVFNGWNAFPVTPTYLPSGTYWLAYSYNASPYNYWTVSSTTPNAWAYTNTAFSFGAMPANMPGPITYDSTTPYISDSIYAVYCNAPTNTPTATRTPSSTPTPTITSTPTNSFTPTYTGSPDTATPTFTPTSTMTITPSFTPTNSPTFTYSPTPNLSLTPDCGAAATFFGDTDTCCGPQTAFSSYAFRACRYTLNQSGTVETMSLYLPPQDAGLHFITVAIYSNGAATVVGNLLTQAVTYQTSVGGWNVFQVTPTPLSAGDYWLAYMYSAPATYTFALDYQTSPPTPGGSVSLTACNFGPPPALPGFKFPVTGSFVPTSPPPPTPGSYYNNYFYEPIVANLCPGVVNTATPTNSPTLPPTFTPTPTLTPLPCGASATYFGSTNTSGGSITLQSVEMLAYQNSLPADGTVYGISLYATDYDVNDIAQVALYSSQGTSMGTLIAGSGSTPQTLTSGWNNFSIPASPVTAGNYWLTYLFQAPVSYSIVYQTPTPGASNTLAYDLVVTPTAFPPTNMSSWGSNVAYTNTILGPIIANYCPGSINTATPTNSPTQTPTFTITGTPTLTPTYTVSMTPTFSPTFTPTGTPTWTLTQTATSTITDTPTITSTLTSSPTSTPTGTPTWTGTVTATFTITTTPTFTPTFTDSSTPTESPTLTPSGTPTATGVFTSTSTPTATPSFTPTFTVTSSMTATPSLTTTATPTATPSSTPTLTATRTATSTPSLTPSLTPTFSRTSTASLTPTSSPTATPTGTATFTPTRTVTPTNTATATVTWTLTPDAEIAKSVSETVANVNDVITFTLGLNVTYGSVANVAVTDVLPAQLNLVGFGSTPPGGVTSWNASTKTLSWDFSALPVGTYTITYQAQVTNAADSGSAIINQAQLAYSGLVSPKTASVTVTVSQTSPSLYPNPLRGNGPAELQIPLNQAQDYLRVKVFTTSFRKVYEDTVKTVPAGVFIYGLDSTRFEGGLAANGIYYVVLTTPSNRWILKLLILK